MISFNLICSFDFLTLVYILIAIVVLLVMVLIHELGHYTAGRLLKFKIEEFSIGFGKAIFSKKNKRGEKISLRIFPLGGYCAFAGENEDADEKNPDAFNSQKPWKRIIVLFMGAFFNFVSAIIFSFILLVGFGYDIKTVTTIDATLENYSQIGETNTYELVSVSNINATNDNFLQTGDVIYYVNDTKIDFAFGKTLSDAIADADKAQAIEFKVKDKNGNSQTRIGYFNELTDKTGNKYQALGFRFENHKFSFLEALARCVPFAVGLAWLVLKSLWLLITFQLPIKSVGGPLTTITTIAETTQQSISSLFIWLPLISANLAAFNLLPFPALDGCHILFTIVEWIRKKPINKKVEGYIHFAGLCILLGFVVIVDILHFVL